MKKNLFETSIWHGDPNAVNSFVDFRGGFTVGTSGKVVLKITCDGAFSFKINGRLAGFGESTDFPYYKEYHTFDISKYCDKENEIVFTVWHYGENSQTYIKAPAMLAFRIEQNGEPLLRSGKTVTCRANPYFDSGFRRKITNQLGFSYLCDLTAPTLAFEKCDEFGICEAHDRKIANLKLRKRVSVILTTAQNSVLADLGKETVGFLDVELNSPKKQKLTIAYGEHLRGGHVARCIEGRDFSVELIVKEGFNKVLIPFRRLAGRYLEVFADNLCKKDIKYIGIRPVEYPVQLKARSLSLRLDQEIYNVCTNTLLCCMHEHYEDCPWREQALYAMDSRNQMLCGYYAFRGARFQRHSLILIAKSLREDGLLSICAPSGNDVPIPFFSLVYPVQVAEYVRYTGDKSIINEVGEVIRAIMQTFKGKIDESGLIPTFPYPYWNFYEWSDGNDNANEISRLSTDEYVLRHDLILNCMYVYAAKYYDELFLSQTATDEIKSAIQSTFFDESEGLYRSSDNEKSYSQLGNALAFLIGLGDDALAKKLADGKDMTPITLSMTTFLYDALLNTNKEKYAEFVVSDIRRRYKKMLDAGATTFWETELGAADFGGAGSLCHGWSAMPVYYYCTLNIK